MDRHGTYTHTYAIRFAAATTLIKPRAAPPCATQVAVRTCEIDQQLLALASTGTKQVVLLGAGLDNRAWRCV